MRRLRDNSIVFNKTIHNCILYLCINYQLSFEEYFYIKSCEKRIHFHLAEFFVESNRGRTMEYYISLFKFFLKLKIRKNSIKDFVDTLTILLID